MSVRASLRSRQHRHKRIKHRLYKYGGLTLSILSIFYVGVLIVRADFMRVGTVAVQGTQIVPKEEIEQLVAAENSAMILGFLPKDNIALVPKREIEQKILNQFSTVANVSVGLSGLDKLIVNVEEYKPEYLWCVSLARDKCFFMNSDGYVFVESAGFSQGVLFTYYGLLDGEKPVGQTFLPLEDFRDLNRFIDSMKLLSLTPVGLNARGEDDFEILLSNGGSILFSNREPFLTTFENLETIIADQSRTNKNFLSRIEYIDVRFASKAFIKLMP